jgi:hypothetical protein
MIVLKTINYRQYLEHNGRKFRAIYKNLNSGVFDSFDAEVLCDNGWVNIASKADIPFAECTYSTNQEVMAKDAELFFAEMRKHIELLY